MNARNAVILIIFLLVAAGIFLAGKGVFSLTPPESSSTEQGAAGAQGTNKAHKDTGNHTKSVKPTGEGLFVYAGAGIRPPLDELGAIFRERTGTEVVYSYKGSGCLLTDIAIAKQGDLYIPGETYYMDQALCRNFITTSKIIAGMTTVIVVQPGNPKGIYSIKDLAQPDLRLGFGEFETVAAGKAAKEALQKANAFEGAQKNAVMAALNIVEVGNAMKLRHLDAAIVWDATAALYSRSEMEAILIEKEYSVYSPIPVGILTFSEKPKEAEEFMNFLASEEAGKIFLKHGFSLPTDDATKEREA